MHYIGVKSYLFVNGIKLIKIKGKDSNIVATPLCLGNISKDFSVHNMKKKKKLNRYVYDFSVNYDPIQILISQSRCVVSMQLSRL